MDDIFTVKACLHLEKHGVRVYYKSAAEAEAKKIFSGLPSHQAFIPIWHYVLELSSENMVKTIYHYAEQVNGDRKVAANDSSVDESGIDNAA